MKSKRRKKREGDRRLYLKLEKHSSGQRKGEGNVRASRPKREGKRERK